jgi:hypothetical protein
MNLDLLAFVWFIVWRIKKSGKWSGFDEFMWGCLEASKKAYIICCGLCASNQVVRA